MSQESSSDQNQDSNSGGGFLPIIGAIGLLVTILVLINRGDRNNGTVDSPKQQSPVPTKQATAKKYAGNYSTAKGFTNLFDPEVETTLWWSDIPRELTESAVDTGTNSNITVADYTGPDACAECHQEKYESWTSHAHRWMNAEAVPENVKGDFSGEASIKYQGGVGTFYREANRYRMKLVRGSTTRIYEIQRTIGARFFQYYTGRLIEGSEAEPERLGQTEHVLPFGYWIDSKEWVPTVHVYRDTDYYDDARDVFTDHEIAPYDTGCSGCHVTRPFGDWLADLSGGKRMSAYSPKSTAFDLVSYLAEEHPDLLPSRDGATDLDEIQQKTLRSYLYEQPFDQHGVGLGISCEACHMGGRAHIAASTKTATKLAPHFFPVNPHLHTQADDFAELVDRSDGNSNLICARCHSGGRKPFANGAHTWNSTEFADGVRGFCYTRKTGSHPDTPTLTCITCHDPHEGIGPNKWKLTEKQNSQKCIACHEQFNTPEKLTAHTHHGPDSAGSQCMNCHNPKIMEGLQDMVHTHRTFNPTDADMIEANQPNACNLCHLDQPIDWTISHLREWYGEKHRYDDRALIKNYPNRTGPVGLGWLQSTHHSTRLVAAEALAKTSLKTALPALLDVLVEDSNIINRQFTQRRIDEVLGLKLRDLGYQFYHSEDERKATIAKLRPELVSKAAALAIQ